MKTQSKLRPGAPFEINVLPDGMAEALFYDNVEQSGDRYAYDLYCLVVPYRDTLGADIEANYDRWLAWAREAEDAAGRPLTAEERIAALERENARLREENALTANALDEFIRYLLGGEE